MQLPDKHILQFQLLYKDHFGEDISREDAYQQGIKLVRLMQLIYKPITQTEFTRVQNEIVKIRARINKKNQS